jgi:hypothetical protein
MNRCKRHNRNDPRGNTALKTYKYKNLYPQTGLSTLSTMHPDQPEFLSMNKPNIK